ncbi:hypothetical protein [Nostoc sp. TCL240-02]|uniref:hypothetical protein n=1 Tax=Nostoc sp. TCL240-02 TaxID=2572090 RepID=UPI00157FB7F3|nr:hypothetical protein [Nostoc sp. TCL240-02]QKQ76346.1 hypothetical protein FBB35_26415 [Nostoc sp. TCL240-02]
MPYIPITLQDLFGQGATQTSTTLTLFKADLYGLTPSPTNSAELILTAILLRASTLFSAYLSDENGTPIITNDNDLIGYENSSLYELLNVFIWDKKYYETDGINLTEVSTIVTQSFTDIPTWE